MTERYSEDFACLRPDKVGDWVPYLDYAEVVWALRGLLAECEAAKWPLTAKQMLPMDEARRLSK